MKKILAGMLTFVVLMSMVLTVSAAEVKTKTFTFPKDYDGDGTKDYSFTMTKMVTNDAGKAKSEREKFPKVSKPKDEFTSGQLTHPGGNVNFYVVKEGSTIDMTGSAFIYGYAHSEVYKLEKKADGSFQYGSFTPAAYKKLADPLKDMMAASEAGYEEFKLTEANFTEKPMNSITWGVRGEGSKLVLQKEGYYVLNILAPTKAALRNPLPTDMFTPAVTEKALEVSCVFVHVVK